ncbi:hypothetical protein BKA93DRAFT_518659 [Sparassis latifolia]|uniref:Uncharacterized protein n=1 Tax=Sparassis crispa TaxID=139825 RepID=A0A401GL87_9APHY|nr:hypothetical protein SCP_0412960 [Sparassis crispa]GBE82909.1 hypothetical protein SCP_0412960 [Sparassis crispa]
MDTDTDDDNPPVHLSANSIYISLQLMLSPGSHWALLIVDAHGSTTRHHWAATIGADRAVAERYSHQCIDPVSTYTRGHNLNLSFCKIVGYSAPAPGFDFVGLFQTIFPESSSSIRANRNDGSNCRIWIIEALMLLQQNGLITRADTMEDVRRAIATLEAKAENALAELGGDFAPIMSEI